MGSPYLDVPIFYTGLQAVFHTATRIVSVCLLCLIPFIIHWDMMGNDCMYLADIIWYN